MDWIVPTSIALIATVLSMLALRPVAKAVGLVDKPGGRKFHKQDVPVIGGLAMYLGLALGCAMVPVLPDEYSLLPLAAGLLVAIGVIDDRFGLPTATRLLTQVLAVLIMIYGAGLVMRDIGNPLWIGTIGLGPLAVFLTIVMSLTVINSFNLIDGMDGLAGCMVLIALLGVSFVSQPGPASGIAAMVGACVLAYLFFNLPMRLNRRIRSFMGDAGSIMLGFVVVWITISICQGPDRYISPVVGLWFAALPLFDLLTCFVRRAIKRKSPLRGGRDHIHHTLRRGGFRDAEILVLLSGLAALYATVGVIGHYVGVHESLLFAIWSVAGLSQYAIVRKICAVRRASSRRQPATV